MAESTGKHAAAMLDILRQLHRTEGYPRLEIECEGGFSKEAEAFCKDIKAIRPDLLADGPRALYLTQESASEYCCLTLPRAGIDSLVDDAVVSQVLGHVQTVGLQSSHAIAADGQYGLVGEPQEALVQLDLAIDEGPPKLTVAEVLFTPYPKDFPRISVGNRHLLCTNCEKVWLEPWGREPDFNHCVEMDTTRDAFNALTAEQRKLWVKMSETVLCPCYTQTQRYSAKP